MVVGCFRFIAASGAVLAGDGTEWCAAGGQPKLRDTWSIYDHGRWGS